jgi:hypothetical protein
MRFGHGCPVGVRAVGSFHHFFEQHGIASEPLERLQKVAFQIHPSALAL